MAAMHYSYLNAAYNNQVNNDWDSMGCMKAIKQKLGYRLVLQQAIVPEKINRKAGLTIQVKLNNKGFASPFNPRPVQLILRNKQTGKIVAVNFSTQIQKWFTGDVLLKQHFALPREVTPGTWELLLDLPDGYASLQTNPLYSIRLANENTWEPATGFNKLGAEVRVQ
jgi:hypothetical protein